MRNRLATPLESDMISPEHHSTGISRTDGEEDVIAKGLSCGRMSYLEVIKKLVSLERVC